ncbi:hypothetical protein ACFV19_27465 [Streptomyces griseoluteus]|uniref:hypothetical protein n=1 Tax=Streptomyces griseoluteus TaxID=29306 RepID=UPI00369D047F
MTTLVFTAEDVSPMRRAFAAAAHGFQVTPSGREGWDGKAARSGDAPARAGRASSPARA